jgi:4a-hydroxytetrahydrobiopterin dehydratase
MSLLNDAEIERRLADLPDWRRGGQQGAASAGEQAPGEAAIARELAFADFREAVAFVNRVAEVAEAASHHPDILVHGWNKVRLTLSTHSAGGLTDADFELAAQLDRLA